MIDKAEFWNQIFLRDSFDGFNGTGLWHLQGEPFDYFKEKKFNWQ